MKNLVFLHRNIPLFISSLFMGHSSSRDGWEPTQWIMDTSKFTHILSHPANFCVLKQRQVKIKFYQKHITPNGVICFWFYSVFN